MNVDALRDALAGGLPLSWLTVALLVVLLARALAVLGRGPAGAAWRNALALAAGLLVTAQLLLDGPAIALLPLHALAVLVVALMPWERPHPEVAQLRLGRNRRRNPLPWPRALLLVVAVAAAGLFAAAPDVFW